MTGRLGLAAASGAVICAVALAGGAWAQEKGAGEPRKALERAAFAEEHERDLERAAKLYEEAAKAAEAAKDEATAKEARAALARVLSRLGRPAPAAPAEGGAPEVPLEVEARIHELVVSITYGGDSDRERTISRLVLFGTAAVPRLRAALLGETVKVPVAGPEGKLVEHGMAPVRYDVYRRGELELGLVAKALSRIDAPEAAAALGKGLESPDPVVRMAVAEALRSETHRALLERAAKDPVREVRSKAVARLAGLHAPELAPIMDAGAREGISEAAWWLGEHAPERLLAVARDESLPARARELALSVLTNEKVQVPREDRLDVALRLARSDDRSSARRALDAIWDLIQREGELDEPLRERIETAALGWLGPTQTRSEAARVLGRVGGIRTVEAAFALVEGSANRYSDVLRALQDAAVRLDAGAFRKVVGLAKKAPADFPFNALAAIAGKGVPPAEILAGLEAFEGDARGWYIRLVVIPRAEPALAPAIREGLASKDRQLKDDAIRALGEIGDVASFPAILALAEEEGSVAVEPFRELARIDPARAAELIEARFAEAAASSPGKGPHRAMFTLLANRVFPLDATIALIERLWARFDDRGIRSLLAEALIAAPAGPSATRALAARFKEVPSPGHRAKALSRFADELHEPAIPLLGEALADPDVEVRKAARAAFQVFKEHREARAEFEAWQRADEEARAAVADLVTLLDHKDRAVVLGAVRSLAALKAKAALPKLVRLLERDDPEVRKAVEEAIAAIGEK